MGTTLAMPSLCQSKRKRRFGHSSVIPIAGIKQKRTDIFAQRSSRKRINQASSAIYAPVITTSITHSRIIGHHCAYKGLSPLGARCVLRGGKE
jgi:hypothetical protein